MLQIKKERHQRVRSEGTAVTIKSNDLSQKIIGKCYNSTHSDWKPVEKQLRKWSNLLHIGKKLTIVIAFHYRSEDDDQLVYNSTKVILLRRENRPNHNMECCI